MIRLIRKSSLIHKRPFISLAHFSSLTSEIDSKLKTDVKNLGATLGNVIRNQDESVFNTVEKFRAWGHEWRSPSGDINAFDKMVNEVKSLDAKHLMGVARAFTHFLSLSNSAENRHRVRKLRDRLFNSGSNSPFSEKQDSCTGTIRMLLKLGKSPDEIINALNSQCVEIVLTGEFTS